LIDYTQRRNPAGACIKQRDFYFKGGFTMKQGMTELVFIIDRSGSMGGLESDTIGGFNAMLKKQQAEEGEAVVTTVLFDDEYELLHDRLNIKAVAPLTEQDYFVRGSTALLDAVGKTLNKTHNAQKHTVEEYRADKVLVAIITDGLENSSRYFSAKRIKKAIEYAKQKYGWEFIFMGANMDAVEEAERIGIAADRALGYEADGNGISDAYKTWSCAASSLRTGKGLDSWFGTCKKALLYGR
jgi:uncharacterized protein YegL